MTTEQLMKVFLGEAKAVGKKNAHHLAEHWLETLCETSMSLVILRTEGEIEAAKIWQVLCNNYRNQIDKVRSAARQAETTRQATKPHFTGESNESLPGNQ
jgi:hypothetical protein